MSLLRYAGGASRTRARRLVACTVLLALCGCVGTIQAQNPSPLVAVEEDWELVVGEPDPNSNAPQVTCVLAPYGNVDGVYAALELNHRSLPEFVPGGLQLQLWNGEEALDVRRSCERGLLRTANETVRWTQQMWLHEGKLWFAVTGGTSVSWGGFGGGECKVSLTSSLADLSAYSPAVSTAQSGVGYAANRVSKLVLKEVRYYSAQGLVQRDTTQRVVHER
jgi:hypothetical protein